MFAKQPHHQKSKSLISPVILFHNAQAFNLIVDDVDDLEKALSQADMINKNTHQTNKKEALLMSELDKKYGSFSNVKQLKGFGHKKTMSFTKDKCELSDAAEPILIGWSQKNTNSNKFCRTKEHTDSSGAVENKLYENSKTKIFNDVQTNHVCITSNVIPNSHLAVPNNFNEINSTKISTNVKSRRKSDFPSKFGGEQEMLLSDSKLSYDILSNDPKCTSQTSKHFLGNWFSTLIQPLKKKKKMESKSASDQLIPCCKNSNYEGYIFPQIPPLNNTDIGKSFFQIPPPPSPPPPPPVTLSLLNDNIYSNNLYAEVKDTSSLSHQATQTQFDNNMFDLLSTQTTEQSPKNTVIETLLKTEFIV